MHPPFLFKIFVGFLFLAATACRTRTAQEATTWNAHATGLAWLAAQQGPDGFWGEDHEKRILTGFAVQAFLNAGHTPASAQYGTTVSHALRAMVEGIPQMDTGNEIEHTVTLWALETAFDFTGNPLIEQAVISLRASLPADPGVFWFGMLRNGTAFRKEYLSSEPAGSPTHAVHQLDLAFLERPHDYPAARQAFEELSALNFNVLELSAKPMRTWLLLSNAMIHRPGEFDRQWRKTHSEIFVQRQTREENYGWWTAERLKIQSTEMPQLGNTGRTIWITSIMLMTFPPSRHICPYCLKEAWKNSEPAEEISINPFRAVR